jgi:hypothetical protein
MSDLTSLSIIILGVAIIIMNLAMMRASRRLDARLWRIVKPEIANTAAPTTAELSTRQVCPKCGSTHIEDHPDLFPPKRCLDCGDRWAGLYRTTHPRD